MNIKDKKIRFVKSNFKQALKIFQKAKLSSRQEKVMLSRLKHLFKKNITKNIAKNSKSEFLHVIDGVNCLILKPSGFSGVVADSYTAEAWKAAEASGLVALPCAGYGYGSSVFFNVGKGGFYWSSSPGGTFDNYTYYACFRYGGVCGFSVRLASVQ